MEVSEATRLASGLYLDLLKKCLTRVLFPDKTVDYDLAGSHPVLLEGRIQGMDWPAEAETMVGLLRLDNLQSCVLSVIEDDVPGDVLEAGVWRGGASIFMRAALKAYGDTTRNVWVADSFQGLPAPDTGRYPQDEGDVHHTLSDYLGVSLNQVQENFERYGLLDDRVRFLPGWFKDTLPSAPVEAISVLRLDGDMYESTMESLIHLYDKVSSGGYVIIDDFALPRCRAAVEDFRQRGSIAEPIVEIDWTGVYWRKERHAQPASKAVHDLAHTAR